MAAHDPRLIHFSGHSWMGSLAFESSDGRIEVLTTSVTNLLTNLLADVLNDLLTTEQPTSELM